MVRTFTTPNGLPFSLECRDGTNDQTVSASVSSGDEYGLRGLRLNGWALDVGAYIGAVAIPLALDHPDLTVVAVEPIPENLAALYRNIGLNGVAGRVLVVPMAAGGPTADLVHVRYGFASQHRYVGNLGEEGHTQSFDAPAVSLSILLRTFGVKKAALLKIDCEGCEWAFLRDPATARIGLITGETHGGSEEELVRILPEHDVLKTGYHFRATRRRS